MTRDSLWLLDSSTPNRLVMNTAFALPATGQSVAVEPQSGEVAVGLANGKVVQFAPQGNTWVPRINTIHNPNSPVSGLAYGAASAGKTRLLASGSFDQMVALSAADDLLYATASREDKMQLKRHGSWVHRVAFCPPYLVSVSQDATVRIWPQSADLIAQLLTP